jgi:hypothetical protein
MNFEDLFDKSNSIPRDGFGDRKFDASMFAASEQKQSVSASAVLIGLVGISVLSIIEGSLLWVIFELIEDFGVIDQRLPWSPFIGIAFALNLIRVLDRSAFGSK